MHILIVCTTDSSIVVTESIPLSIPDFWLAAPDWTRESRVPDSRPGVWRQLSPSTLNVCLRFSGLKKETPFRRETSVYICGNKRREETGVFSFSFFFEPVKKHDLFCIHSVDSQPRAMKGFFKIFHWNWLKNIKDGGEGGGRKSGIEFFVTKGIEFWFNLYLDLQDVIYWLLVVEHFPGKGETSIFFFFQVNSGRVSVNNKFMQELAPFVTALRQALLIEDKSISFFNFASPARNQFEFNFVPSRRLTTCHLLRSLFLPDNCNQQRMSRLYPLILSRETSSPPRFSNSRTLGTTNEIHTKERWKRLNLSI